jgi:hypothetical protein
MYDGNLAKCVSVASDWRSVGHDPMVPVMVPQEIKELNRWAIDWLIEWRRDYRLTQQAIKSLKKYNSANQDASMQHALAIMQSRARELMETRNDISYFLKLSAFRYI